MLIFGIDLLLRSYVTCLNDLVGCLFLIADAFSDHFLAGSAAALFWVHGIIAVGILGLLRLLRLFRVVTLLRVSSSLTKVFGGSVFTLVCGTMAGHLSLRVLLQEMSYFFAIDLLGFFDRGGVDDRCLCSRIGAGNCASYRFWRGQPQAQITNAPWRTGFFENDAK